MPPLTSFKKAKCKKLLQGIFQQYRLLLPPQGKVGKAYSVTRKKLPNVYRNCPKMISLEKLIDFDTFTKIV